LVERKARVYVVGEVVLGESRKLTWFMLVLFPVPPLAWKPKAPRSVPEVVPRKTVISAFVPTLLFRRLVWAKIRTLLEVALGVIVTARPVGWKDVELVLAAVEIVADKTCNIPARLVKASDTDAMPRFSRSEARASLSSSPNCQIPLESSPPGPVGIVRPPML